jgi:hypothetical protein
MNRVLALTVLLLPCIGYSGDRAPKVKPEDMPFFVSVGAVTTFENVCLITYSDRQGFENWRREHEKDRLEESNVYKEESTDDTYRIPTPLVSFVLNASKKNSCTLFSVGTDREAVAKQIEEMLRVYIESGKGGKLKIEDNTRDGKYSRYYAVLSPNDVSYIEVVYSDSVAEDGSHRCSITGATRRRDAR